MLNQFEGILEGAGAPTTEEDVLTFADYLELVKREPWITRNTFQLLHDMLLSSGVERTIVPGKPIKHRYAFFEDDAFVGNYVVFGQQKAKENLVEKIDNASRGHEASKRLWILLGPPGAAKSRSMDGIKTALNVYSRSDEGKTFTLLLPTVDERLAEKALFEENGIYYLQAPTFERPLQIVPKQLRGQFLAKLNDLVEKDKLVDFFERHPHYDGDFRIDVDGLISPLRGLRAPGVHEGEEPRLRRCPALRARETDDLRRRTKTGIGSYTPRDEKSQEAGSLVGNIDYSLLPRFGSESHPLVHDYKGELCAGANGFVEIHEILKLSDRFLYELLFATQDRFFKPEGQPPVPFNGVIIGHTNFHEYNMFMANETFEALRSRTTFIEMPLSVNFKDEDRSTTSPTRTSSASGRRTRSTSPTSRPTASSS